MKKIIILLITFFTSASIKSQTVSQPGTPDPLYPVANFYNESVYSHYVSQGVTNANRILKDNGKYYIAGTFEYLADNKGSVLLTDTVSHTLVNNSAWPINGVVTSAIPDGQGGFYIAGDFTKIGDSSRKYIAQINGNGKPTAWRPVADSSVNVLLKRNDTLFIGGAFKHFAGKTRSCFAMYSISGDSVCRNGGIQAFTFMRSIHTFLLQNDTLIYGGIPTGVGSFDKNIRKYNFKNDVNMGWELSFTDYAYVYQLALSADQSTLIFSGYSNGEYIKGVSNSTGAQKYFINVSMYWPTGSNNGKVLGLQVHGSKAYVIGDFEFLLNNFGTFSRKGFSAFDPLTGALYNDDLALDGYPSFLKTEGGKIFLSGKFNSIRGVSRNQFAAVDTGTLAVGDYTPNASDPLTALVFNGQSALIAGTFRGLGAVARNGFAVIDSATHAILSFNPVDLDLQLIKRLYIRGDSLFVLGYTSPYSSCVIQAGTKFRVFSISTGALYGSGDMPPTSVDDAIIDGNYMYVAYNYTIRRYLLPGLVWDMGWGTNWAQSSLTQHSVNYLISSGNRIYSIGDTRYFSCATSVYPKRGFFAVYDKSTGVALNNYHYDGANNNYDNILFDHALLTNDRLFIQGYFSQLNGSARRNFACININNGLLTNWQPTFPNSNPAQSGFNSTSELKLYNGKIWVGSSSQVLNDGSTFSGFGSIDTLSGNLVSQPLSLRSGNVYGNIYTPTFGGIVGDFNIADDELSIAGIFDSVNNKSFRNLAIFHLTGINQSDLCAGGNITLNSSITGSSYQWQVDSGAGYTNISDNANYSGVHNATLQLSNIPSSWYGYKLRCRVDGANSEAFEIKFSNRWTGSVDNSWENAANWSCGTVPDLNTDVVINSGTIVMHSNTIIRSLFLSPSVNFTVNTGVVFTVLH